MKITYKEGREELGVITNNGETVHMRGYMMGMTGDYSLHKISDEEFSKLEDSLDPEDAPPGPYTVQPSVKGKLYWLTGSPGMGKSTSAQILAREKGYVYYEADGFIGGRNPFVDLTSSNPSFQQVKQNKIRGKT